MLMRVATSRAAPWGVTALTALVCGGAAWAHLAADPDGPARVELVTDGPWLSIASALGLGLCGLVVLLSRAPRPVGWALAGFALFWALDGFTEAYVAYGTLENDVRPGTSEALWFVDQFGSFLPVGIVLLLLLYPTGRFLDGRWRAASWVALGVMTAACASFVFTEPYSLDHPEALPSALDRTLTYVSWSFLPTVSLVLNVASAVAAAVPVAVVVVRHRRARGLDRERMRWLLWAVVVEVLLILLSVTVGTLGLGEAYFLPIVLVPAVAVTIGLVRPRLVRIDDLLGATLLHGLVASLVVGIDLGVLAIADAALGDALDERQVVVVVLLLAALLYGPLRAFVGRGIRRLLLGTRDDPYDVVAGLAGELERVEHVGDQLHAVAAAVAQAFGVRFVAVEVESGSGGRIVAATGPEPEHTRTLPISYRGDEVGRLVLPASGFRARLSDRDERLLADLVRQVALAARSANLADELQQSREQLVLAREEERRRIRRDLHDGLGPALSGVVFQLESARLRASSDPGAVTEHLVVTRDHVKDVIADVRRLVHDLRPPALDDLGLVGAVRQHVSTASITTEVEAGDLPTLPAAVEVAAYRIVAEATTNVARHAQATHCRVHIAEDDGVLVVEVADDGVGVDPGAVSGVGLRSLRERAAELGGRSEVVCPDAGGTVVRAWLPMRSGA